ncbi:hypothetical protein F8S13_15165 [Chloroflexia bacterium SDU3-3]|nr:hypothetical protein F8S13_15165 [Chloroflexia bacterium SDU3-3]
MWNIFLGGFMINLSERVSRVFVNYGWSPERSVDITTFIDKLSEEGFQIFDVAEKFLRNLHGLKIEPRLGLHTAIDFHAGEGLGTLHSIQPWAVANDLQVYAIGMWVSRPIYVDSQGRLYITDFSVYERVSETIEEGLDNLLFFRGAQSFVLIPPILM